MVYTYCDPDIIEPHPHAKKDPNVTSDFKQAAVYIEYVQWHRQDWGGEVRCSHWWVNVA